MLFLLNVTTLNFIRSSLNSYSRQLRLRHVEFTNRRKVAVKEGFHVDLVDANAERLNDYETVERSA